MGDTVVQQRRRKAREHAWALRVEINTPRRGWWEHARCRGCDVDDVAVTVCAGCPVRIDCLTAARLEEQDYYYTYHVRGGFQAAARQRMWKLLTRLDEGVTLKVRHDVVSGEHRRSPRPRLPVDASPDLMERSRTVALG
jgi:hypothetical protein